MDLHPHIPHIRFKLPFTERIRHFVRNILFLLLLIMSSCTGGLYFLSQTEVFRQWLGKEILSIANNQLEAQIEFSDIRGDVLSGLTFDNVRIITQGDTLLYAKQILLRYDLQPLLKSSIVVNYLLIDSPIIKILRTTKDSSWNYNHIGKSSTDTSSNPFRGIINAREIAIIGGKIIVNDSTNTNITASEVEYLDMSHAKFDNVNLSISANLRFAESKHNLSINKLSFSEANSGLVVKDLHSNFIVDTNHVEIFGFGLQSSESSMKLEAQIEKVNLFHGLDFSKMKLKPVQISLNADSISTKDLKRFLPDLNILSGSPSLKLEALGTYGDLQIKRLKLGFGKSELTIKGHLLNLQETKKLFIDATITDSRLTYADVHEYLPGVKLPDLSYLGKVQISEAKFKGETKKFDASIEILTEIGNIACEANINLESAVMKYKSKLSTVNFNLGIPLNEPELSGMLTSNIEIEGEGTNLQELNSHLVIEARNSHLGMRQFRTLNLDIRAANRGIIDIDTLSITFDGQPEIAAGNSMTKIGITGMLNFQNKTPSYALKIVPEHFNLRNVLPKSDMATNMSGNIEIEGAGFNLDSLVGKLHANFSEFSTPKYSFAEQDLRLEMGGSRSERTMLLKSSFADVFLHGNFTIGAFGSAISQQLDNTTSYVNRKIQTITKSDKSQIDTNQVFVVSQKISADFSVKVRNLTPLALIMGENYPKVVAELQGKMVGDGENFSFFADKAHFTTFDLNDGKTTVKGENIDFEGEFSTFSKDSVPIFFAKCSLISDSVFTLAGATLIHPNIQLNFRDNWLRFSIHTDIDKNISCFAKGTFSMENDKYGVDLITADFRWNNLSWSNIGNIRGELSNQGFFAEKLNMRRSKGESVSITGLIHPDKFSNTRILIENMQLADIKKFFSADEPIELLKSLTGKLRSLSVLLNGTPKKPILDLTYQADSIIYNNVAVGNQSAKFSYRDSVVSGSTEILTQSQFKMLSVAVNHLPMNLAFESVKERLISGKPIDIAFKADKLSLTIIAPFIPSISQLQGNSDATFSITGSAPDNVEYHGAAHITKGSFLLPATNIKYFVDGTATLLNKIVTVEKFRLKNESFDLANGYADVTGTVLLEGFDINSFDLNIRTPQLLVMSNATRIPMPTLYGNVVIGTGKDSLNFKGSFSQPILRGNVDILSADIVFPEDKTVKTNQREFCYQIVDKNGQKTVIAGNCPPDTVNSLVLDKKTNNKNIILKNNVNSPTKEEQPKRLQLGKSLMDLLDCEVNVRIPGHFGMTMELGFLEKLIAQVKLVSPDAPLRYVQKPDLGRQIFGDLQVQDGSKYSFYRNFKATGLLSFETGAIDNPKLNLTALLDEARFNTEKSKSEKYSVTLGITGTKKMPNVKWMYSIDGADATSDSTKIRSDAILLIVLGKTQDELLKQVSSFKFGDATTQGGTAFVTSLAASSASDVLTGILGGSVIRSAEINFGGTKEGQVLDFSQARLQFTGELSNQGLQWHYGSTVDFTSYQFSLDMPLYAITDAEAMRNIIVQVGHSVGQGTDLVRQQQSDWEFKIGYRFSP